MHGPGEPSLSRVVHGQIEVIGGGAVDRAMDVVAHPGADVHRDASPREVTQHEAESHPLS